MSGPEHVASARPKKTLEECARPLVDFCKPHRCPSYDERIEEVREMVRSSIDEDTFARAGVCGEWRYVSEADGYTGTDMYFDASGNLVAAAFHSDTNQFCGGALFSQWYGPAKRCESKETRDLRPRRCQMMSGHLSELVMVKNAEAYFDRSTQKFGVGLVLLAEGDLVVDAPQSPRGATLVQSWVEANGVHAALEPGTEIDEVALDVPLDCHGQRTLLRVTLKGVSQLGRVSPLVELTTSPLAEASPADAGTPK